MDMWCMLSILCRHFQPVDNQCLHRTACCLQLEAKLLHHLRPDGDGVRAHLERTHVRVEARDVVESRKTSLVDNHAPSVALKDIDDGCYRHRIGNDADSAFLRVELQSESSAWHRVSWLDKGARRLSGRRR